MFAWFIRFALLLFGGKIFRRVARHPRIASLVGTRKGRLALLLLGLGLRRHRRMRVAGRALRQLHRRSRRAS